MFLSGYMNVLENLNTIRVGNDPDQLLMRAAAGVSLFLSCLRIVKNIFTQNKQKQAVTIFSLAVIKRHSHRRHRASFSATLQRRSATPCWWL